ncbi:MAG: hypothetical protein ACKV2T_03405 [Kofleriaceae bacterium]
MKRLALVWLAVLAACPPPKGPGTATGFRVIYPDAEPSRGLVVTVGERMQAKPAAQDCTGADGGEARWATTGARVTTGELPPGLVIEDGAIGGVPSREGTYKVTIRFAGVTCGSMRTDDKLVHITIVVEPAKAAK